MNIIIPMAGEGQRFFGVGKKPFIPVTNLHLGKKIPMVASAILDLPRNEKDKVILIGREPEKKIIELSSHFSYDKYIEVRELTHGQAASCMLSREEVPPQESLLISNCDHGMAFDQNSWMKATAVSDVLVFTSKGHEEAIKKPESYGWIILDHLKNPIRVTVKEKPILSENEEARLIIGTFWFKEARSFYENTQKMMDNNDRRNNEFYVDQVMNYILASRLRLNVFEVDRFHCWGTPAELEQYENKISYWRAFLERRV